MEEKYYSNCKNYIKNLAVGSMFVATRRDNLKITLPGGTVFLLKFSSAAECNEFWAKSINKIGAISHEDS